MEILESVRYVERFRKHFFNGCNYYFSKVVGYDTLLNLVQKRIALNLLDEIIFETNELIDDYGITSISCRLLLDDKKNAINIQTSKVHVNTSFIEFCLLSDGSQFRHKTEDGFIFYSNNKFICDSLSDMDNLNKEKCLYYIKSGYISYDIDLTGRNVELVIPLDCINPFLGNHYDLSFINDKDNKTFSPFKENAIYYTKLYDLIDSNCKIIYNQKCLNILATYLYEITSHNFKVYMNKLDKLNSKVNLYIDFSRSKTLNNSISKMRDGFIYESLETLDKSFFSDNINIYFICEGYDYSKYKDLMDEFKLHFKVVEPCVNTTRVF